MSNLAVKEPPTEGLNLLKEIQTQGSERKALMSALGEQEDQEIRTTNALYGALRDAHRAEVPQTIRYLQQEIDHIRTHAPEVAELIAEIKLDQLALYHQIVSWLQSPTTIHKVFSNKHSFIVALRHLGIKNVRQITSALNEVEMLSWEIHWLSVYEQTVRNWSPLRVNKQQVVDDMRLFISGGRMGDKIAPGVRTYFKDEELARKVEDHPSVRHLTTSAEEVALLEEVRARLGSPENPLFVNFIGTEKKRQGVFYDISKKSKDLGQGELSADLLNNKFGDTQLASQLSTWYEEENQDIGRWMTAFDSRLAQLQDPRYWAQIIVHIRVHLVQVFRLRAHRLGKMRDGGMGHLLKVVEKNSPINRFRKTMKMAKSLSKEAARRARVKWQKIKLEVFGLAEQIESESEKAGMDGLMITHLDPTETMDTMQKTMASSIANIDHMSKVGNETTDVKKATSSILTMMVGSKFAQKATEASLRVMSHVQETIDELNTKRVKKSLLIIASLSSRINEVMRSNLSSSWDDHMQNEREMREVRA